MLEVYGQPPPKKTEAGVDSSEPFMMHSDASNASMASSNGGSRECIACLSLPRDTIVLPCRHMCLCAGCAEGLRVRADKCPLCRQQFTGFLRVTGLNGEKQAVSPTQTESDIQQ